MTTEKILLASVNDVKDFVSAVTTANCDIDIAADRYVSTQNPLWEFSVWI